MKRQKSKLVYYILGAVLFVGFLLIATQEIPLKTEHVEQPLANDFLSK